MYTTFTIAYDLPFPSEIPITASAAHYWPPRFALDCSADPDTFLFDLPPDPDPFDAFCDASMSADPLALRASEKDDSAEFDAAKKGGSIPELEALLSAVVAVGV